MADQAGVQSGSEAYASQTPPSTAYVNWLLAQGDTRTPNSPLHRLGVEAYDAARGNHKHNGQDSSFLFSKDDVVSGDISTTAGQRTALKKIISLLARLGATDGTTG